MKGNLVEAFDNGINASGALIYAGNYSRSAFGRAPSVPDGGHRPIGAAERVGAGSRGSVDVSIDLHDRGACLFQARGIAFRASCQVFRRSGDFIDAGANRTGGDRHRRQEVAQRAGRVVEIGAKLLVRRRKGFLDLGCEIASRNGGEVPR